MGLVLEGLMEETIKEMTKQMEFQKVSEALGSVCVRDTRRACAVNLMATNDDMAMGLLLDIVAGMNNQTREEPQFSFYKHVVGDYTVEEAKKVTDYFEICGFEAWSHGRLGEHKITVDWSVK